MLVMPGVATSSVHGDELQIELTRRSPAVC